MDNFRAYKLIQLVRAVNEDNGIAAYAYEAIVTDNFGRTQTVQLTDNQLKRDWCKLRMGTDMYAKLDGGKCMPISAEEHARLSA